MAERKRGKGRQAAKVSGVQAGEAIDLGAREEAILKSVIREHILTGEPIGSRTVSRRPRLDLSPATIRSVMAELEEHGLLTRPHASAGRLPTAKAYRLYVDRLIRRPRIGIDQSRAIDAALLGRQAEIPELLEEASRQLSRFSNQVGVVLAPEIRRITVEHLEFVRLAPHRVVAILVGRTGVVHNRILEVQVPIEQSELDEIGGYLSDEFRGRTLPEIRAVLERRIKAERAAYDRMVARSLELGRQAVEGEESGAEVYVEGALKLVGNPEFSHDPEKIRELMAMLERKKTLVDLLSEVLQEDGVQVVVGEGDSAEGLGSCSLVASSYGADGLVLGTLGIVGPTRMEYAKAIALVDYLAQLLSSYFSGPEN